MANKVSKPKLVKDWDKMPKEIVAAIKAEYPNGFSHKLINYTTPKGEKVLALPYDMDDIAYLVRVTVMESKNVFKGGGDDEDDDDAVSTKAPREDLDLDGLDIDGLKEEDDAFSSSDDDEEEYVSPARRRRSNNDDEEDDDDY